MPKESDFLSGVASLMARLQPIVTKPWEDGTLSRRPKEMLTNLTAPPYEYTPLNKATNICLLHLEPDTVNELIQCSLRVVDLTDSPSFPELNNRIFLMVEGKTPYVFRQIENMLDSREPVVFRELLRQKKRLRL